MKRLSLPVVVLGLLLQAGAQAMAGPILDFTGGVETVAGTGSIGWEFAVTSPVTVGALGLWDAGADGFASSHPIGLWTGAGSLLASTTITTANSAPVASTAAGGQWRFTPISPLVLSPGDYVLGAAGLDSVDSFRSNIGAPITVSTLPEVTFVENRVSAGVTFVFPTEHLSGDDPGFFGPNLFAGSLAAPEPSAVLLLGTGLAGLAGLARCRGKCYPRLGKSAGWRPDFGAPDRDGTSSA